MAYTIPMNKDGTAGKPKSHVEILQEKSKGTGWGKITRQKSNDRLKKLMEDY